MTDFFKNTEVSPWAHPVGRIALLARHQALWGLKPIGPHGELAVNLLGASTRDCGLCKGSGLFGTYGGLGRLACPACHGLGVTYRVTPRELETLRQAVLARYPDAAVPGWIPGRPIRCPVLDIGRGLIIDACPVSRDEPVQLELAL